MGVLESRLLSLIRRCLRVEDTKRFLGIFLERKTFQILTDLVGLVYFHPDTPTDSLETPPPLPSLDCSSCYPSAAFKTAVVRYTPTFFFGPDPDPRPSLYTCGK